MSDPKTTDYCGECGESPDSGSHVFDHDYKSPIPSDGLLHGACPVSVDELDDANEFDVEGFEVAVNTREGINVDETWQAIRQPVTSLAAARMLLNGSNAPADIAILNGGFTVVDGDGIPVAHFEDIDEARLYLSIRALVELAAKEASRANLAESHQRGLEATLEAMRNFDRDNPIPTDPDYRYAHAKVQPEHTSSLVGRGIAVYPENYPGDTSDLEPDELKDERPIWIDSREARALAASLLRAADEYDAYLAYQRKHNVGPGTEFPNMKAEPVVAIAPDGARMDVAP